MVMWNQRLEANAGEQDENEKKSIDSSPLISDTNISHSSANSSSHRHSSAKSFFDSIAALGAEFGEVIGNTVCQVGKATVETASGVGGAIASTTVQTGKAVVETTAGVGEAVSHTATEMGKATVDLAKWMGETASKQAYHWVEQTTHGAGQVVTFVGDNWLIRKLSGVLKLDWLVGVTGQVDLQKAESAVRKLQQKYPTESPSQIAHRLMLEKATYVGGLGFVTSFLPGEAIALLAVDLATTTALQAEMVYQIAFAYGLNLKEPARKGEVLAIFGLALGGNRAVKLGLGFLRSVPLAGAIIGASTNAAMMYAMGYAACHFYETKLQKSTAALTPETLDALEVESEKYLNVATVQQAVMDQILVHMITASYPEKSWEAILPNLAALQLNPVSLEAIATSIKSPRSLDELLDQLNYDFAVPLLAQCYRISKLDNESTAAEAGVMRAIANKFGIDLEQIREQVETNKPLSPA
ncbi:MAG: hypothetical protein HC769_20325 [Cyanobacteria bacterium CRU_2_1]|nr:hypothetical protein [Cyanobacteria bacterium RU_5_0]NJR60963.1 hypothetical protein [Cyanobacteria bacterium CRU_2_1]